MWSDVIWCYQVSVLVGWERIKKCQSTNFFNQLNSSRKVYIVFTSHISFKHTFQRGKGLEFQYQQNMFFGGFISLLHFREVITLMCWMIICKSRIGLWLRGNYENFDPWLALSGFEIWVKVPRPSTSNPTPEKNDNKKNLTFTFPRFPEYDQRTGAQRWCCKCTNVATMKLDVISTVAIVLLSWCFFSFRVRS